MAKRGRPRIYPELDEVNRRALSIMYLEGWSIREIASALNSEYSLIRRTLLEMGVPLRGRGKYNQ